MYITKETGKRFKYRLSEREKYANDKQLAKDVIDDLIPRFSRNWIKDYNMILSNYRLYNNDISQEDFERVCNPLGIDIGQYDEEVLPYNKTYQKIDVLLGEEFKRGLNYALALLNPKALEQKDNELRALYRAYIEELVEKEGKIAQMEAEGASVEELQQAREEEIASKSPEEISEMNFLSELEILGNDIMGYGIHHQDIRDKRNDGFKHALLSDREFVYVGVSKGEPHINLINPGQCFYEKDPETRYIQDGDWAGHRVIMSVQKVLEIYGQGMKKKDREKLEKRIPGIRTPEIHGDIDVNRESTLTNRHLANIRREEYIDEDLGSYTDDDEIGNSYSTFEEYVEVVNVEWKWLREVAFLTYTDEYGEEQMDMVDAKFPIPDYATEVRFINRFDDLSKRWEWQDELGSFYSIEKLWIPRVWEGVRIEEDIFVNVREKPYQITDMDNPYKAQLGYHGVVYNSMNAKSISLMERMKPFQYLFFVVMHQIKELIPKNIGPIQNFDTSMIDPNIAGIDGEGEADMYEEALAKTLFYRQKGLNIYNSMINNIGGEARETNISRPQPGTVTNMSSAQDLGNLLQLLGYIDQQIGMAAGVSPQRESMFSSNTNVTDNQQAIVQSSHITEHYFRKHNSLWKEVMQSYINYGMKAWSKNPIKRQYILNDGSIKLLEMKDIDYDLANFGLFVTDIGRHEEYMSKMEELALAFMQNSASIEQVSYILKARANGSSPEQIHKEIVKLQRRQDQREEQMQQQQQEMQKQMQQAELEAREDQQEHEYSIEELKIAGMLEKAEIDATRFAQAQDVNDNDIPDRLEVEKLKQAGELEKLKLQMQQQENEKDRNLKRQELSSKERTERAKISANKNKPSK